MAVDFNVTEDKQGGIVISVDKDLVQKKRGKPK
jgi:hypothetical protein